MKLDYLSDLYGRPPKPGDWPQQLLRRYDFGEPEHQQLLGLLESWLAAGLPELRLDAVPFIASLNCRLLLRRTTQERGIRLAAAPDQFVCELTTADFQRALDIMREVSDGYAWLDEVPDSPVKFLYSPGGTW